MTEVLKRIISLPKMVYGSENCTVTVELTNFSDKQLTDIKVESLTEAGVLTSLQPDHGHLELDALLNEKSKLIRELEIQVREAYRYYCIKNRAGKFDFWATFSAVSSLIYRILREIRFGFISFTILTPVTIRDPDELPQWAEQACKIKGIEDLERLENEIISELEESHFLRKAFEIDKTKLIKCEQAIECAKQQDGERYKLSSSAMLAPGETISFPFKFRAPFLVRAKDFELHFKIYYKQANEQTATYGTVREKVHINASFWGIPLGATLGSMLGVVTKIALIKEATTESQATNLPLLFIGSATLAIIVALFTARTPDSKKPVTVEDAIGGLIIGALAGLFSGQLIERLAALVSK